MKKVKCPYCNKTLMKMSYGEVEIKCDRCKKIVKIKKQNLKNNNDRAK